MESVRSRGSAWRAALLTAALCAVLSGCGLGTRSAPSQPPVSLSLIAPTDGATVGVRDIVVTGTVSPAGATVRVLGSSVTVHHGTFTRSLRLAQDTTSIPVTATAAGYLSARQQVTVHFSRPLAVALVAAHRSVSTSPAPLPPTSPKATAELAAMIESASRSTHSRVAVPATSAATTTTAPVTSAATPAAPATNRSAPAPTPLRTSGYHPGTPAASSPAPAATAPAAPRPAPAAPRITAAMVRTAYLRGCDRSLGHGAAAFCGCTYYHLTKAGLLASAQRIRAMDRQLAAFERTHDIHKLPKAVLVAIMTCAPKLPQPSIAVSNLPSLDHGAVPAPQQP